LQTLVFLSLSSNQIGDAGVIFLANSLENNVVLKKLFLSDNRIGDQGAGALARALKGHLSLEYLGLNNNKIGNVGAIEVSNNLGKNNNLVLECLLLRNNCIEDEGARAIVMAFNKLKTLFRLDLRNNQIEDKENIEKICETCERLWLRL